MNIEDLFEIFATTSILSDMNSIDKYTSIKEMLPMLYEPIKNHIKHSIATEKELEEVKAMIKEIGDSGVSFDTSHQRVVFEALMNKVGRK